MQTSNTNQKTAQDWVRQLRFSNEVNMQTVGVDTDKVTPQLLLASSNKLLKISRGQQQGDQKDALQFQKIYGPVEYFAQRIQKDGGSVARSMLWKATNKGNLDFIGAGSLQPHISAVFNESNLTRFIDNSTPLQGIDTSMLVTRVGEGGISSQDTAPIEMRLVQPSYFGFIDGVRCYSEDTQIYTKQGWICIKDMTKDTQLATLVEGKPQWNKPLDITNYEYEGPMYGYESQDIEYLVSPGHRMWVARQTTKRVQGKRKKVWGDFKKVYVQQIHQKRVKVLTGPDTTNIINNKPKSGRGFYIQHYKGRIYCPTVPGGLVYVKRGKASFGIWSSNTQEKSPGITGYLTKNVMKGTDGKLYQKFYNTRTGKEEYVSSMKAARSIVTTPEYMDSKDKYIYALGGDKGVRIVKREDVDYILPRADEAWSTCANNVPMLSGIKSMRLLMGCHHPDTPVIIVDKEGYTDIVPAKRTGHLGDIYLFGCDAKGNDKLYPLKNVVPRPTGKNAKFKKVILKSGRTLLTSFQHKWYIYNNQKFELIYADQLKPDMLVPRSVFSSIPVRRTKIMGKNVTEEICVLMGRILRTLSIHKGYHKFTYVKNRQGVNQRQAIEKALKQLGVLNYRFFQSKGYYAVSIKDPVFIDWLNNNIGTNPVDFKIPKQILTLPAGYTCAFLDSYYKDLSNVGQDNEGTSWLLEFNNQIIRDGISFMLTKIYTDSKYRDSVYKGVLHRALQLCPLQTTKNDIILQKIVRIQEVEAPALMIDLDCDDNVYAVANGIITHNSKYATQAVPLQQREAPLVRSLDEASGMDMPTILGKKAGSQWAPKAGVIKAVRQDRIDLVYDDGTTGSVNLYKNFPANTKGWISNYVKVKAGQKVNKGQLLATSNYTDENGVLATGRNLRVGYLSYKGGTYEDGCTISQSAAKKMAYTTMYKTAADKDKSIRNSKSLYNTWKPGQYSKQQMQKLDDDGIVKVGSVINKGDPMILGIRTTEPSPGTMGKRLLTDVTEVWDHAHPGVVTDVVNGKSGIKVYATVSSPLKEGDKISALYGNKATCYDSTTYVFTNTGWKLFKDLTDEDKVATLDMDGNAHFQKPSDRQVYDYEGQMIGFDNRYINFLVTPDHKMWCKSDFNYYRKPQKPFQRIPAQEIYNRDFFHRVAAYFPDSGFQPQFFQVPQQSIETKGFDPRYNTDHKWKTQDMAAFLGIFLSQGNLKDTYHIKISQKRILTDLQSCLRCDQIEALLTRMGFKYHCDGTCYIFSNKALYIYLQQFGKSADKYVPQEVFTWSRRLQQIFLEWFYIGDGQKVYSNNHKNKGRIRAISKRLIEGLQRLYILNGYEATVKEYKDRTRSYKGVQKVYNRLYGVSFFTNQFRPTVGAASRSGDKVYKGYYKAPYKGKVYCCTVSTGVILVEREGCPMWCGNCSKILPDQEMPKDQKGRPLEVLFDPLGVVSRCYDKETQFLTREGWKLGKDIRDDEQLYSYNSQTNTCHWSKQIEPLYKKHYKGIMYGAKTNALDFLVTPGHRFFAKLDKSFQQLTVQEIYKQSCTLPAIDQTASSVITKDVSFDSWYTVEYDDMVYCPTVDTGYVVTRRNGKVIIAHNTNPSQLMQVGLGKVARKIGKPIIVPQFMPKGVSRLKWVKNLMKQHNVPWKENVYDPSTGRTISNVFTGEMYFLPLKHISDTKMSARGTASYTADGVPASGGYEGCFTGQQIIKDIRIDGQDYTDIAICDIYQLYKEYTHKLEARSYDFQKQQYVTKQITDVFQYEAEDVLSVRVFCEDQQVTLNVTKNHKMYLEDGTSKLAGQLTVGDTLAGEAHAVVTAIDTYSDIPVKVYDFTVQETHNYIVSPGINVSNSKRIGQLETAAVVGHNAFDFLVTDAKLIRGQSNADFWRSIRTGQIPVIPGQPLVHKKFFAHLQGSGMNVKKTHEGISIFALSNKDVDQLAGHRELKSKDTYEQKTFQQIPGGLFGKDIFGDDGQHWAYIQLDQPLPNPVMQQPLARLLRLKDKEFEAIVRGKGQFNGLKSARDIQIALSKVDLQKEKITALKELKEASPSKKDDALKRYVAVARMEANGVQPSDYMLDKIPVLPPKYRPITSHGGLTMVADSNYLYAQLIDARDDAREAKDLPQQFQKEAQSNIYTKWKQLVGLYDPSDVKLKGKNVKGLLRWALGKSPKYSAFNMKVLGSTVDTVGRGVVIPSTKIKLNQIGMPVQMAWDVYQPFVVRKLVQQNYSPIDAMKMVKKKAPVAQAALKQAVQQRPVVMNRAPSLHKLSLMGFNVKLTSGSAIKVNPSIVVPFNMDFDGDTVWNQVQIWFTRDAGNRLFKNSELCDLTFLNTSVNYRYEIKDKVSLVKTSTVQENDSMFDKETTIQLASTVCSLEALPVVEGSAVKKSETVTEWDVQEGFYTNTVDPSTGKIVLAPITKVSKHENLKMFDCTLSVSSAYSHVVTASEDHSLITLDKNTLELTKTRPEDAVGALVPIVKKNEANSHTNCAATLKLGITYPLSYNLGVFLGAMIGDGWVDPNLTTLIACSDPSLQNYIISTWKADNNMPMKKDSVLYKFKPSEGRFSDATMDRITVYLDAEDALELKKLIGRGAENKRIAPEIMMGSRTALIGVLCGLLATDGHIGISKTASKKAPIKNVAYHTISPTLRDNIQELCMRLGIRTRVTPYMGANSKSTCYAIGLCLEDVAKLKRDYPNKFIIPVDYKEASLQEICTDINKGVKNSFDLVPYPRGLFCEFSYVGAGTMFKGTIPAASKKGYIKREYAKKLADVMEAADWEHYFDPPYLKLEDRSGHTPEQAKALVDKWIAIVRNEDITWEIVESVTPSTVTEGWDCTVPGPYTFALSTGTVVQDTVNLHVPVSKRAIEDIRQNMMPQRNLISMRNKKILYKPQKGYIQGLYVATRMGESSKGVTTFNTLAEARDAFRSGKIDIDSPIIIKQQQ